MTILWQTKWHRMSDYRARRYSRCRRYAIDKHHFGRLPTKYQPLLADAGRRGFWWLGGRPYLHRTYRAAQRACERHAREHERQEACTI